MLLLNLNGEWKMKRIDEVDWIGAVVPGSVYNDLLRAGKMKDPFYRDNEKEILELSKFDYEYKRNFFVEKESLEHDVIILLCEGLDTLCEVFINNISVLKADNMHRTYEVNIKSLLISGENVINVIIKSPTEYVLKKHEELQLLSCADAVPGISHIRKAHCMFGWDWGPQLPDMGIWRSISICSYNSGRIDDVYITQNHSKNKVSLDIRVRVEKWCEAKFCILTSIETPDGEIVEEKIIAGLLEEHIVLDVQNPKLWWPHNYGDQPLYKVKVSLFDGQYSIDSTLLRIGLRTITVKRQKDQWGESFEFEVNSTSIFSMGGDYIPEDNILARCSFSRTEKLIKSCIEANFNSIRVWGGGYYPEDYFYDLCDEYGLIVWQDHLYACGNYEFNNYFKENIRHETLDNMKRLRHHASLGLWCGNNELEYAWAYWGWLERCGVKLQTDYIKQFEEYLPEIAREMDPNTFYWVSSPSSSGYFNDPNNENYGDMHYWDVWHGRKPITEYRKIFPRFMSEFGIQSFPNIKTVESFTLPEDRNIFSYVMESHQKNGTGNEKVLYYIGENYKYPKNFDSLLYASQLVQAEGMRYGVEHWRRNRGRCMGAIYWQLNDCWPVASWSSLDYYGRWKASHYAARRFFAPVLASAFEEGTTVVLHISNETRDEFAGKLSWSLRDRTSAAIQNDEFDVKLDALSTREIISLDYSYTLNTKQKQRETYLEFILTVDDNVISCGTVLFVKSKHFALLDPQISTVVSEEKDRFIIEVSSKAFARFVELDLKDADAIFSDNIFDLSAEKVKKVEIKKENLSQELTLEVLKEQLTVRSLFDTFE
jgi:beta-mannosidase